jgi:hypothetical protein
VSALVRNFQFTLVPDESEFDALPAVIQDNLFKLLFHLNQQCILSYLKQHPLLQQKDRAVADP